jgi:hypothetical protein
MSTKKDGFTYHSRSAGIFFRQIKGSRPNARRSISLPHGAFANDHVL